MGSYSYFGEEEIKVTDAKGLTKFLLQVREEDKEKGYYTYMYESFLNGIIDGKQYSFEEWNDIKLISYWYDHQVIFLYMISKYIEGDVSWTFENPEEQARLEFKNGKTIFKLGEMIFKEIDMNILLSDRGIRYDKENPKINMGGLFKAMKEL